MLQRGFADGIDVETDFVQRLMVEVVAAVEQECGLNHTVENFLIVERFVFLPLGQQGDGVRAFGRLVRIGLEFDAVDDVGQIGFGVLNGLRIGDDDFGVFRQQFAGDQNGGGFRACRRYRL